MKDINIKFIKQCEQRNPDDVGDYWETDNSIEIRITNFGDSTFNIAAAIHEIWEDHRNHIIGLPEPEVMAFDIAHSNLDDPGLSSEAPYHRQHMEGDALERLCVLLDGKDWNDYDKAVNSIFNGGKDEKDS